MLLGHCLALLYLTDVRAPVLYELLSDTRVQQPLVQIFVLLAFALAPTIWLDLDLDKPSKFFVFVIYFATYIPSVIIAPGISERSLGEFVLYLITMLVAILLLGYPVRQEGLPRFSLGLSQQICTYVFIAINFAFLAFCLLSIDVDLRWRAFEDVYDIRELAAASRRIGENVLVAYVQQWLMAVTVPALVAIGLWWKKLWVTLLGLLFAYVCYQAFAEKVVLASCLAVFWVRAAAALSGGKYVDGIVLFGLMFLAAALALALDYFVDEPFLVVVWYMRSFLVPGLLTSYYVDYFSDNLVAMYGDSALGLLFGTTAAIENIPQLIGNIYVWREVWANANFWADGYANLGIAGIVAVTIVLKALLVVLDAVTSGRDRNLVFALSVPVIFALGNTALQRVMGGNGFWLLILLVVILPVAARDMTSAAPDDRS